MWNNNIVPVLNRRYRGWLELDLADRYTTVPDAVTVHGEVMATVAKHGRPVRIFILGGHEVVPLGWMWNSSYNGSDLEQSIIIYPLPGMAYDQHTFIYSDDPYADFDGDFILDVPIARLPDGRDYGMVMAQLGNTNAQHLGGFVLSTPSGPTQITAGQFGLPYYESPPFGYVPEAPHFVPPQSRYGHFHLHGDQFNFSWAGENPEKTGDMRTAFSATDASNVNVVISAACFGAYIAPAWNSTSKTWVEKTTNNSIALHFLANGTDAYIGGTDLGYDVWEWKCKKKIPILGTCLSWDVTDKDKENDLGHGSSLMVQYIFEALAQPGVHPMDAFFQAKRRYGLESPVAVVGGPFSQNDETVYNTRWKILWEFIYYGPPPP